MGYKETISELYRYFQYMKKYTNLQYYLLLITLAIGTAAIIEPLVYRYLIDEFFLEKNIKAFYAAAGFYVAKSVFFSLFNVVKDYFITYMGCFVSLKLRGMIFDNVIKIKSALQKTINIGDIFVTIDRDVSEIENNVGRYLFEVLLHVVKSIGIAFVMLFLSWQYFLAVITIRPILLIMNNNLWVQKLWDKYAVFKDSTGKSFGFLNEAVTNQKNIKILSKEIYAERKFFRTNRDVAMAAMDHRQTMWMSAIFWDIIGNFDKIIMLAIGGILVYGGQISIGTYIALTAYELLFRESLGHMINLNVNFHQTLVAIKRIDKLINIETEEDSGEAIDKIEGEIFYNNVTFSYESDGKKILENFSLKIKKGEKIAIVGESGSGKSTIINLLLGLFHPVKGEILIDGKKLCEDINVRDYRRKVGVVSQDNVFFFKDTILENLTLGDRTSEKEIIDACKSAEIWDSICETENGLNAMMEAEGSNFSGGQRQRLSIARMLIRKPDLIILDEATSALDNIVEMKVQESLDKVLKEKTVITIAHRLSTIKNSDRIIVLQDGKITEEGTHDELCDLKGYYYRLVNRKEKKDEGEINEESIESN